MADKQQQAREEAATTKTEVGASTSAHEFGMRTQFQKISDRKQNPQFYDKYTDSSLKESEKWAKYVNEYAALFADDHVLANRRQVFRQQADLLDRARAEQAIVGANPGGLLRAKPLINALAQGVNPELDEMVSLDAAGQQRIDINDPEFTPPMSEEEKSMMDDIRSIWTARKSQGVDNAGSEALTTATSENRTVREESEQGSGGIVDAATGVFD